jgi:hypothetical protein
MSLFFGNFLRQTQRQAKSSPGLAGSSLPLGNQARRRQARVTLGVEQLEARDVPAVFTNFGGALLDHAGADQNAGAYQDAIASSAPTGAPALIGPSGSITSATPTFTWTAVAGADHYDIWINDLTTGQSQALGNSHVTGTSWTPGSGMVQGHSYRWWGEALSSSGEAGAWSGSMDVSIAPLATPTLTGPAGSTSSATPTFTWNAVAGADHYYIWIDDLNTGQALGNSHVTGTSWTPGSALAQGHSYRWWVEALSSSGGASAWSGSMDSSIAPLATPTLIGPAGSTTNATPTFSWSAVAGADHYYIWISDLTTGQTLGSSHVTGTSWTPGSGMVQGHSYRWWVEALNSSGGASAWSGSMDIRIAPLGAPSFTLTPVSPTQINIAWSSVAGASGYLVDEWVSGAWRQIANLGSGSTSYAVTGLSPGTTYYFDVAAFSASSTTWAANYQSAATPGNTVTIDHPAAGAAYSPVANGTLFGANGPSYLDVRQGAVGDCWLMASLAEVAARYPADIRNMFTYDGTTVENGAVVGVYTVRLFDHTGAPHNIIVDTELPAGGTYYDHVAAGVMWAALAEKAYVQANGAGYVTSQHVGSDSYAALEGGYAAWALQAITGRSASQFSINPSNIAAAWNAGQLIVLDSSTHASSQYIVGDSSETHAYAVVGYDPSSSNPFKVYNPWGTDAQGWALGAYHGHAVWGLFNASAAFLSANFAWQTVGVGAEDDGDGHAKSADNVARTTVLSGAAASNSSLIESAVERSPSQVNWDALWAEAAWLSMGLASN